MNLLLYVKPRNGILSWKWYPWIRESVDLLWCKGRTTVQEYYMKLGFEAHGDVFDYPPIGPHIVMVKKLL
ncbi:hypothetical protein BIV60_05940 [Bacillus sp. MUM 116]|uniref:hypothetical protein n=1 Tax=Bacillus sp. MUM 116 TaxID=1678002 RepID=UPI0008F5E6A2|nr:hypothetical protein [Bacillus sp. MUM 116]OIK16179.1 hypothetical protein BIV60_05940 [Bacillus sp. MUM 116]